MNEIAELRKKVKIFISNNNLQNIEIQYSIRNIILEKENNKIKLSWFIQKKDYFDLTDISWIISKIQEYWNLNEWDLMTFVWEKIWGKKYNWTLYRNENGYNITEFWKNHFFDKKWNYILK